MAQRLTAKQASFVEHMAAGVPNRKRIGVPILTLRLPRFTARQAGYPGNPTSHKKLSVYSSLRSSSRHGHVNVWCVNYGN